MTCLDCKNLQDANEYLTAELERERAAHVKSVKFANTLFTLLKKREKDMGINTPVTMSEAEISELPEYFCKVCGQLRLRFKKETPTTCGNCGSTDLIVATVGELDKEKLKADGLAQRLNK